MIGENASSVHLGARDQSGELFSAETTKEASGWEESRNDGTEALQDTVADRVTVFVVDLLEMVEVEQQQRQGALLRRFAEDRPFGRFHEGAAVAYSRQKVEPGRTSITGLGTLL